MAFGVQVVTFGGDKIRRLARRLKETPERTAFLFYTNYPLDRLRQQIPVRSGSARRSLSLQVIGAQVKLLGRFYTYLNPLRNGKSFREYADELARETLIRLGTRTQGL